MKTGKFESTIVMTAIGPVTVEADDRGVTGIVLPGPNTQKKNVDDDSPPDNPILRKAAVQIKEYLQGQRQTFTLPLHLNGTDFQKKVWKIMSTIPYGATMSYGDIARQLGGKGKARAVGGAAHVNPIPLIIPCHRVIGSDGSLTGFGGGLGLKKNLLELEKEKNKSV